MLCCRSRLASPSLLAKLSSKAFASFTAAHLPSRTVARAEAKPAALGGRFDTRNIEPTAGEADSELGDADSAVVESDSATVEVDSALGEAVSVTMESYTVTVEADLVLGKSDSTVVETSLNRRRQRLFTSAQANLAPAGEPIWLACVGEDFLT